MNAKQMAKKMLDKLRNKGCLVKKCLQLADRFPLYHSLQENRPLPKSFFTTMMEIEKKQVRMQQL